MKTRWLLNLLLLLMVGGVAAFIYLRPKPPVAAAVSYEISTLKMGEVQHISVEPFGKAPVTFDKVEGLWRLSKPLDARADQFLVQRILSLVAAQSRQRFAANDLAKFGLDVPRLTLRFDQHVFSFGTFNPVTEEQYVLFNKQIYMIPASYADSAQIQVNALLDKSPIKSTESITGFDFSHLEQWEETRLNVNLVDGQWKASPTTASLEQNAMNEWFDSYWRKISVSAVEPYTPDRRASYPYFEVMLKDGKRVHFDKIQESPELLLARPDEGMIYHLRPDLGFTLLNPPVKMEDHAAASKRPAVGEHAPQQNSKQVPQNSPQANS
jgi:hypothetical protein